MTDVISRCRITNISRELGLNINNHHDYELSMAEIKIRYKALQKMLRVLYDKPKICNVVLNQMARIKQLYSIMEYTLMED